MQIVNTTTKTPPLSLSDSHIAEPKASAISDEVIQARGYRYTHQGEMLPGEFSKTQQELNGLLIPIRDLTGEVVTHQLKPQNPRTNECNKAIKYETASGVPIRLELPAQQTIQILDESKALWITEG